MFPPPPDVPLDQRPMPDWATVHRELRRPNMTLALLWEEYRSGAKDGFGYSWFCNLYRAWAGRLKPTLRQVHVAGEKLFVDFAGHTMEVIDGATGEVRKAEIFVAVLGASSYIYAEATWSQMLPDWIAAHVNALAFFGGVTQQIVCDFVPGNKIGLMCPAPLCGGGRGRGGFRGGPRTLGHITGYSVLSQSRRVLSFFQAARARDAAEIPEPNSQTRRASALARKVNSA